MARVKHEAWELVREHPTQLWIHYVGPTSTEAQTASLAALQLHLAPGPVTLVIDLRQLVGHNPDSLKLWSEWLRKNKKELTAVHIIIPKANVMIRMLASATGLGVGIKLRLHDSDPKLT